MACLLELLAMAGNPDYLKHYAEVYSMFTPRKTAVVVKWIEMALQMPKGRGLAVDIGCGPAEIRPTVTGLGYEYLGVDTNPYILARAQTENPGIDILRASAQHLPLAEASANVALMNMLVHSFQDLWKLDMALEEGWRVLTSGGLLILTMLNERKTYPKVTREDRKIKNTKPRHIVYNAEFAKGELEMDVYHWPRQSVRNMMEYFCGFDIMPVSMFSVGRALANNQTYEMILGFKR